MKFLITGGAGFIGVALAEKLVKNRSNKVFLLDRNFEQNTLAFSDLQNDKNVTLVEVDVLDLPELTKVTRDADVIVHMAAKVGVQEVLQDSLNTLDVNYIGTSNLLKAAAQNHGCKRIVCFSTSEIFGPKAFRIAEDGDTVLSSTQDIRWSYCISKLASEHLAFSYFRQKGLPVVVVRPFNIFGPKRVGDHVVLRFILKALRNENLEVYGDGTQIRAWCYIDDFCNAVLRTIEVDGAVGQAFNIGNPRNTITVYDLAKKVLVLCGSRSKIVFKAIDFADVDIRVPNASKAKDILGFVPEVELEEGLSKTIEWVRANLEAIESLLSKRKKREYVI